MTAAALAAARTSMDRLGFWIFAALLVLAGLGLAGWLLYALARRARRRRLFAMPLPAGWAEILERNLPLYRRLPAGLRRELGGRVNVFLGEKRFLGCAGLEITDEIRVTVAGQACILLLNRKGGYYPGFSTVLVYPGAYLAEGRRAGAGAVLVEEQVRLGESWQGGPVVLAWDQVTHGARDIRDGHNVVLHEFAHKLDQEDGRADGAPVLGARSRYVSWARVLGREYQELCERAFRGRRSVLDRYGATDPAEFFAVLTEAFFEKPRQLRKKHPELYAEAREFYRLDPLEWSEAEREATP